MKKLTITHILLAIIFTLTACTVTETAAPSPTEPPPTIEESSPTAEAESLPPTEEISPAEDPIYLAIIWHQHQPVYYKNPETNVYVRPWVRVHATKDYVDMAAMLEEYPNIHATFNLTPSLIRQLDDLSAGTKDLYWVYAEIPAEELNTEQKEFILARFFDTNREVIGRFPRYQELLSKRDNGKEYSDQDFRDLQILFNLAWVDPDWLAQEPLAALVEKGENFAESDKVILFQEHLRLIQEVIPVHKALQDAGQIEITMTPFAHPILPLLVTTDLARNALPGVELPATSFVYGQDAVAQVELGVGLYEEHFGVPPRGMWPAEGSVAQEIVTMVSKNGIQWMASDEGVLANSLGIDSFTRDSKETVSEADTLYRPYYVQGMRGDPVAMVFRDIVISDKVGFTYSGMQGELAAADFLQRIHNIRDELQTSGTEGPHLVSVILDGENAWEHYENDGKAFLHSLYQLLSEDDSIITVTPSEFLEIAPDQPQIDELWAGSWISHDFSTWIGEEEENTAWEYLADTRAFLQEYITGKFKGRVSDQALNEALTQMYIAEGSDWFWWYGADQNSGNDEAFDQQFRDTLKQIYTILGVTPPTYLDVPIIPEQAVAADTASTGLLTPTIDGIFSEGEWEAGGMYLAEGGVMASGQTVFESLSYGFDADNLYLAANLGDGYSPAAADHAGRADRLEFYLSVPGGGDANNFSRAGGLLGFPAKRLVVVGLNPVGGTSSELYTAQGDESWGNAAPVEQIAWGANGVELAIPLTALGNATMGDRLSLRATLTQTVDETPVDVEQIPTLGPASLAVPDLGTTTILLNVEDPENDDHGPGTYTYPSDSVFNSGNFDILNFQFGYEEENIVFKFAMRGPVENPWGSPNGLAIQTFDIYLDVDGDGEGGVAMLPGRNLSFEEGYTWDYAITVEGWTSGVYIPSDEGPQQVAESSEFSVLADPGQRKVTVRVPMSILGDNPENWRVAAVVLSQEGYPSGGVMRVRDVLPTAEQWRIGGAPAGATNHTRVMDFVWPEAEKQEAWLSNFAPTDASQTALTSADFATVPMMEITK